MKNFSQVFSYLERRGARYEIELKDMLSKTPESALDNPEELTRFWKNKDISHKYPIETHPELQNDPKNWFPEDIKENRSRNQKGAVASESEIREAYIDNEMDVVDQDYDDDGYVDNEVDPDLDSDRDFSELIIP